MKGLKNTISLFIVFLISFSTIFTFPCLADGMIHYKPHEMDVWQMQSMSKQLGIINYDNGNEKMILALDAPDIKSDKIFWIFPIPANPENVDIDILKGFPYLYGKDIFKEAHDNLNLQFILMSASQIYTIPPTLAVIFLMTMPFVAGARLATDMSKSQGGIPGVEVYEHVESMGVTSQLVGAKTEEGFNEYLTIKGIKIPQESRDVVKEYIGKDYSFVVSWISTPETYKNVTTSQVSAPRYYYFEDYEMGSRLIGIYVSFPTEKIYFPLKMTSVYNEAVIPVRIYVFDYVTPEPNEEIKPDMKANYYYQNNYSVSNELSVFFNNQKQIPSLEYTKIDISTPSKNFKEDLWMIDSEPSKISTAEFIISNFWLCFIVLFIISSCLASLLSGIIVFKGRKPSKIKFALLGLANFLTIIGFSIASYILKIDNRFTSDKIKAVNSKSLKEVAKFTLMISFGLIFFTSFPFLFMPAIAAIAYNPSIILSMLASLIGILVALTLSVFAFLMPFGWGYFNNRSVFKFTLIFSALFLVILLIFWVVSMLVI